MEETPQVKLGLLLQNLENAGLRQDKILTEELTSRIHEFTRTYIVSLREYHKNYSSIATKFDITSMR